MIIKECNRLIWDEKGLVYEKEEVKSNIITKRYKKD